MARRIGTTGNAIIACLLSQPIYQQREQPIPLLPQAFAGCDEVSQIADTIGINPHQSGLHAQGGNGRLGPCFRYTLGRRILVRAWTPSCSRHRHDPHCGWNHILGRVPCPGLKRSQGPGGYGAPFLRRTFACDHANFSAALLRALHSARSLLARSLRARATARALIAD